MIQRCQLAPDLEISRVVTGLWQVADMERDGRRLDLEAAADAMAPYADAGLTTFDMADHYGSAEVIAGLFHLQELREEGLVRHLGLTNVDTAHLRIVLASGLDVVSNQICFSLLDPRPLRGMTELCVEHGVRLLAYGTLAGGLLTERWLGRPAPAVDGLETWSQMKYRRFIDAAGGWDAYQALLRTADEVARAEGTSIADVACPPTPWCKRRWSATRTSSRWKRKRWEPES